MAKIYGFGKKEHLYLQKEIEGLFSSDKKVLSYPFRALYTIVPREDVAAKLLISAPKRRLKHAVDRNRVKRLVREAYRLHKQELSSSADTAGVSVHIAIIFIGEELPDYDRTEKSIRHILHRIHEELLTLCPSTTDHD